MVAVCDVTPDEVPVMVSVSVPCGVPPEPPQPDGATKTSSAPAIARRVRSRCSEASRMISIRTSAIGATTLMEPGGSTGADGGGVTSAVVANVNVAVAVPPAVGVTDDGAITQVERFGAPVQASATAALKVPTEVTVMVEVPLEPLGTVEGAMGEADKVKPGVTGVVLPVRVTICGLVTSVSTMVSVAVSAPAVDGV